jgi:hypothetical protein
LLRRQKRVERHRHDAGADRAEEHGREIHRVEHDHRDALFAADAEPAQHVGDPAGSFLQIPVSQFGDGVGERELGAAAFLDIAVEQPRHRIVGPGTVGTGVATHDASPQILRIIIHIKPPSALAVNLHRHYPSSQLHIR